MKSFGGGIELYVVENRVLPTSLLEMTLSHGEPPTAIFARIPLDPWEEPYAYKIIDEETRQYQITSSGPDQQMGTADDLFFPEKATEVPRDFEERPTSHSRDVRWWAPMALADVGIVLVVIGAWPRRRGPTATT
jgi:hypothetical protein